MIYFQLIMRVIYYILTAFIIVCSIRILLSWFHSIELERIKSFFNRLTDPYLNLFRGLSWARIGILDLSVMIGVGVLLLARFIVGKLAMGTYPTIVDLLIFIGEWIWGIIAFLIFIMAIIMLVRMIFIFLRKESEIWFRFDNMLTNITSRVMGLFTRKPIAYSTALAITSTLFLVFRYGVGYLLARLLGYPDLYI